MSKPSSRKRKPIKLTPTMVVTIVVALITSVGTILSAAISPAFDLLGAIQFGKNQKAATPTQASLELQKLLSIHRNTSCFAAYTPDFLFEGQDTMPWLEHNFYQHYEDEDLMYAPRVSLPERSNVIEIDYALTSINPESHWIRISKKISVSIQYLKDVPATIKAAIPQDCEIKGNYRSFPDFPLKNDYPRYGQDLVSVDPADFFTLQPGEFEVFALPFRCERPGIYAVSLTVHGNYQGQDGSLTYTDTPTLVCPRAATYHYWETVSSGIKILDVVNYEWTNSRYEQIKPIE